MQTMPSGPPAAPTSGVSLPNPQHQQYYPYPQQSHYSHPYAIHQGQQQLGRVALQPTMYPVGLVNRSFGQNVQSLYSTYPARLKQSDDNALLLPNTYLTSKKPRFASESEDDFDELADDSDEGTPSAGIRTRSAAAAAVAAAAATVSTHTSTPTGATPAELRKVVRKKSHIYPPQSDVDRASAMEEVLVPIRLDIDLDDVKLRDVFLWNMNEQSLTPEKFAEMLCEDLDLPVVKFLPLIAESIRSQVVDFEAVHEVELPPDSVRVVINLDLQIGKINLRDRFEWDLENTANSAPEIFSRQLAAEVGLGGEYVSIIAHAIREQLYKHKRQWVDESLSDGLAQPLSHGYRNIEDAEAWAPQMEVLSNDELEKLLIAQERNIRRLRRETRFKRSRRHTSVTSSRRYYGTP